MSSLAMSLQGAVVVAALAAVLFPAQPVHAGGKDGPARIDAKLIPAVERFDWQPKELVAVLGEHRGRQGNPALCVAVSPDGKQVASGGSAGYIRLWDRATMRLQKLVGHSHAASALAYSEDGTLLLSTGYDGGVRIWKMDKGVPTAGPLLTDSSTALYAVGISPNKKYVAGAGADAAIHMWQMDDKGQPRKMADLQGHTGPISALSFAPDNKTFASGSHDGTVRLWGLGGERVKELGKFQAALKEVRSLAYSRTGTALATGDSEGNWRLWNMTVSPPRETAAVATKHGAIASIAFGPRGSKALATGHADFTASVWSLGARPPRERICTGHANIVNSVAFVPSRISRATALVTASSDWTVRLWDITVAKPYERTVGFVPKGHLSHVYTVDFAPDGKTLASGAADTGIRLWDVAIPQPKARYHYTRTPIVVYQLRYSPDGKTIAYGGADTSAYLWDPVRKLQIQRFTGHPSHIGSLTFSPDGRKLLTCSLKELFLFDVESAAQDRVFKGHTANVGCIAMAPDGKRIVSGAGAIKYQSGSPVIVKGRYVYEDCTVRLWDADSGKELAAIKDHDMPVLCTTFARDGRLYYGLQEPLIRQFTFKDDKPAPLTPLKGTGGYVHNVTMSPDGKLLASVGLDGQVILWDAVKNTRLRSWTIHEVCYRAVFSADSRHLALPLGTGVIYVLRIEKL